MLAYTSVNAESVTEKGGNSVETDNDGDTENAEYGLSVDDYDFSEIDEIMKNTVMTGKIRILKVW